eukprot:scaffold5357_cov208-Amphora_coffeaeformis.AAC.19
MFPDVHMLTSDEFLAMDHDKIVLVDVRSMPEQAVSVVEGGVPLSQLDASKLPLDAHLVTYCTVGFRACLEARRLQEEHPSLRVSCLDGIACYTHVDGHKKRKIVEPSTGQQAKRIHTFGEQWACASDDFEPIHFSGLDYAVYSAQFATSLAWRSFKTKLWKFAGVYS